MSKSFELKALREQRAAVAAELRKLGDKLRAEGRAMTAEERDSFGKMQSDFVAKGDAIRSGEKELADIAALIDGTDETPARTDPGRDDVVRKPGKAKRAAVTAEQQALALQGWMRSQSGLRISRRNAEAMRLLNVRGNDKHFKVNLLSGAELRAQSLTDAAGGYTVPEGFSGQIEYALKAFGGVRNVARVIRTATGNTIPWPTVDDTANAGEVLAENTAVNEQDVTFGVVNLGAQKYSSKAVKVSNELMQDSAFDLATELGNILGTRLGRVQGVDFTTGDGTGNAQGVVTGASAGITAAGAAAITGPEIVRLKHAVDPAYRMGSSFGYMLHDGILAALAILVDGNGQPLFTQSFREGTPDRLSGLPVFINQHMQATLATATVTVLCGDFSRYAVRDAGPVRLVRLDERYADADQVGFMAWMRSDGRYLNTAAVKKLTQA